MNGRMNRWMLSNNMLDSLLGQNEKAYIRKREYFCYNVVVFVMAAFSGFY